MTENNRLEERLLKLEKTVEALTKELSSLRADLSASKDSEPYISDVEKETFVGEPEPIDTPPPPQPATDIRGDRLRRRTTRLSKREKKEFDSEYWLNRIGVGLFLFGVAFLFKYSIDKGWISPTIRVGIGLSLGIIMIAIGAKVRDDRRRFGQFLSGGGVATLYISVFASYKLYHLVSYPLAFAAMVTITVVTFYLSLKQNEAIISATGVIGGLATPFILYTGTANLIGLMVYTSIVVAGSVAIYFFKGWRSLLWLSAIGGLAVIILSVTELPNYLHEAVFDRWVVQAGLIWWFIAFWAIPVAREIRIQTGPDAWTSLDAEFDLAEDFTPVRKSPLYLAAITPLALFSLSNFIWAHNATDSRIVALTLAALYGVVAWRFYFFESGKVLWRVHAYVTALLVALAISLLADDNLTIVLFSAEAFFLSFMSRRFLANGFTLGCHALFAIIAIMMFDRFFVSASGAFVIFNTQGLSDLAAIAFAFMSAHNFSMDNKANADPAPKNPVTLYRIVAYSAFIGFLGRELSDLQNGQAYITISWGALAVALLLFGFRSQSELLRKVGMATIFLVVGKLFIVDLSNVETIWRIFLFLIFGGVLLAISYFGRGLGKSTDDETGDVS